MKKHATSILALVVSLAHFASFGARTQPLVTDIRYYLYFAWRTAEGDVPHVDFFDNKTQLATFVGALLYRAGEGLGADPLLAIRHGYGALAALGGWLVFLVFRRLAGGSSAAGFLALVSYGSFQLMGILPAIGNVPKMLMAVLASAMALCVARGAWFLAGVAGALAFMDWQIGALVWLCALVSALVHAERRGPAALRVVLGGVAGMAPFVLYYALSGGLADAAQQTIAASFFRGEQSMERQAEVLRLTRIGQVLGWAGRPWLVYASLAGVPLALGWLWTARRGAEARVLLPLCLYHLGVLGFNLIDFAGFGDLLSALHSVAFLLAVVWVSAWRGARARLDPARRPLVAGVLLLLALAVGRPGVLLPREGLRVRGEVTVETLADQREAAAAADELIGDLPVVFLQRSEVLFLLRRANPLPIIYWNDATWYRFRADETEPEARTVERMLAAVRPRVVVWTGPLASAVLGPGTENRRVRSSNGAYSFSLEFLP